jgi:3-hydroxymyristoyl/3-hydroxydecanoyl-(acyl carrier protein) dehydratase
VKFNLIDSILELSDTRIVAVKQVSLAEEYLADHFPTFPVLPGVMMLEALTQAAAWLLHRKNDFSCSMAVLKEAKNVKYGQFVAPGDALRVEVELFKPHRPAHIQSHRLRPHRNRAHRADRARLLQSRRQAPAPGDRGRETPHPQPPPLVAASDARRIGDATHERAIGTVDGAFPDLAMSAHARTIRRFDTGWNGLRLGLQREATTWL